MTVGALDAASQLVTKHDVGELGLAVSTLSGVVANALEFVELDSTLRLYVGGPCSLVRVPAVRRSGSAGGRLKTAGLQSI